MFIALASCGAKSKALQLLCNTDNAIRVSVITATHRSNIRKSPPRLGLKQKKQDTSVYLLQFFVCQRAEIVCGTGSWTIYEYKKASHDGHLHHQTNYLASSLIRAKCDIESTSSSSSFPVQAFHQTSTAARHITISMPEYMASNSSPYRKIPWVKPASC